MKHDPWLDGATHVNIYSKSRCELGRLLSNFAEVPFDHPVYGKFKSIEGFWYWLTVPNEESRKNQLRLVSGYGAKILGRALRGKDWESTEIFKRSILEALEIKAQNEKIKKLLSENTLPFAHYYVYDFNNGKKEKIIEPSEGRWLIDFWESKSGILSSL